MTRYTLDSDCGNCGKLIELKETIYVRFTHVNESVSYAKYCIRCFNAYSTNPGYHEVITQQEYEVHQIMES